METQSYSSPTVLSPTAAVGDFIDKIDGALGYITGSNSVHEQLDNSSDGQEKTDTQSKLSDKELAKTKSSELDSQCTQENGTLRHQEGVSGFNYRDNSSTSKEKKEKEFVEVASEATEEANGPISHDNVLEEGNSEVNSGTNFSKICNENIENFGLPLKIFTGGNLCHPYVSLAYLDTLTQPSVHGYMIGATNDLFLLRKGLTDVIIKKVDGDYRLDVQDPELKKALQLTTEDLRFTENLVQHVCDVPDHLKSDEPDVFLDGIGWEGGDEWVRAQFRFYLVCLLRTVMNREAPSQSNHFNRNFIQMWKKTKNYRAWRRFRRHTVSTKEVANNGDTLQQLIPGHPYGGNSTFFITHDISLHVKNAMQNTESGKRVSKAVASTGQAVSKGLSSAKSTLSSISSLFGSKTSSANGVNISSLEEQENIPKDSPKAGKSTLTNMQNEINETIGENGDYVTASP